MNLGIRSFRVILPALAALVACSGFSTTDDQPAPDVRDAGPDSAPITGETDTKFTVDDPAKVTIIQGRSAAIDLTIQRSKYILENGIVIRASLAAPPAGFTATPLPIGPGEMTAKLALTAAAEVAQGDYMLDVELKADSGFTLVKKVPVFVRGPAGSVDTTFGASGYMRSFFGNGPQALLSQLFSVGNGLFLALGECTGTGGACMARFDSTGKLDTTYGTNGLFATTKIFTGGGVLLPSGALMLIDSGTHCRVLANGGIDTSYGSAGCTNTTPAGAAVAAADGSLYIITSATAPATIAKVTPSGADDTSFGSAGTATVTFPGSGGTITDLIVQKDGNLVVTGHCTLGRAILRLNGTTGAPVGSAMTSSQSTSHGGLLELKDSRVVMLGDNGTSGLFLAGYLADLTVDTTFGTNGATSPALNQVNGLGYKLARMSDGRFVTIAGSDPQLVRFTANGDADTSLSPISVVPVLMDETPLDNGTTGSKAPGTWILDGEDRLLLGYIQKLAPTKYDFLVVRFWN